MHVAFVMHTHELRELHKLIGDVLAEVDSAAAGLDSPINTDIAF